MLPAAPVTATLTGGSFMVALENPLYPVGCYTFPFNGEAQNDCAEADKALALMID